jgi:hypothetical protein
LAGLSEDQNIEKDTAERFLHHYNDLNDSAYAVVRLSEAPDVICRDSDGAELNLEITLTEDRDMDIAAALGRSPSRSIGNLKPGSGVCLQEEVLDKLVKTIAAKLTKDYGPNAALIVRSVSGVDWSWGSIAPQLRERIDLTRNPFDSGIWLLNLDGSELFRLI